MENQMTEIQRLNDFMTIAPEMIRGNRKLIDCLSDHGFFRQAASTKYHGNYAGGLYDHSKDVWVHLQHLTDCLMLDWQRPESPFIVGMFHDLCKIDQYREVVDDPGKVLFGSDEPEGKKVHYEFNQDTMLTGHGAKSIMLLAPLMQLTEEEMLCIRYHMGAYEKEDWDGFGRAMKRFPTVLYTHTADMLASKIDGR